MNIYCTLHGRMGLTALLILLIHKTAALRAVAYFQNYTTLLETEENMEKGLCNILRDESIFQEWYVTMVRIEKFPNKA